MSKSVIIYKDGSYILVQPECAWEYQNDDNILITINNPTHEIISDYKEFKKSLTSDEVYDNIHDFFGRYNRSELLQFMEFLINNYL